MKTNKTFTNIELYIISSKILFEFIEKTIKIDIKLKKKGNLFTFITIHCITKKRWR
jgi:hypothetical protein